MNTIYYKQLFDKNQIKPDEIKSKKDLTRIPPLTREALRENFDLLQDKHSKYKKFNKGSSSGSTGQAVFYLHDEFGSSAGIAAHYLGWYFSGFRFGLKGLHIWGNPAIVNNVWNKRSSKIKSKLFRLDKFPAYQLTSTHNFDEIVKLIKKNKYEFIDGYTNAIYLLADYLEKEKIQIDCLKFVLTTAENLHDYQRSIIERNLSPVFDEYGCGEIMGIAYQNMFNKDYVIIDPHVVVEYDTHCITDDSSFPLLITDLDNKVMPLIRYQNGDLGKPGSENGINLPFSTMKSVSGRVSDLIELPGGGHLVVPSFFGSVLLKEVNSIKQYQVELISSDKLIIKFVVDGNFDEKDKLTIDRALTEYLKNKIKYEIKIVNEIPFSTNGKFKLLIDKTK
jgi:phenylacetate-CoA ligase